jgi:hypothetical protein
MEQFASKESILHRVITDPRQRLARFYKSQQQPPSPELTNERRRGGKLETGYMQVDPGTIHRPQDKPEDPNVTDTTAQEGEEGKQDQRQSTSLAEYILPPLSPVVHETEDHSIATSLESIQKQKQRVLPLETEGPFDFNPGSYLHYRLPSNVRLNAPELLQSKERGDAPQPENPHTDTNTASQQQMASPESPNPYLDTGKGTAPLQQRPPRSDWTSPSHKSRTLEAPFQDTTTDSMGNQEDNMVVEPVGIYQDPSSARSSSTSFLRQIATLESSVDAFKNANYGIWQTSASSIRQLKDFHLAQQSTLKDLIAQRDHGVDMARKSQEEYSKLSQKLGDLLGEKDAEINALKDIVAKAQVDRCDVEKIAEEAIAAQDSLERVVSDLEKQLLANQSSSQGTQAELERIALDKDHLSQELRKVKSELFACKSSFDEKDCELENLENERRQIARQLGESENAVKKLQDGYKRLQEKHQVDKEEWSSKLTDLQRQNRSLSTEHVSRETELANRVARLEEELRRCKEELASAKGQLEMHVQQDQIFSKSMQSERAAFRHEITQLRNALNARSSERDKAMEQLDQNRQKYDDATADHDRTRDDLVQRVADVEELSAALRQALEEQETLRDELFRKDRSLEDFQVETRHRVQRVTTNRDEMAVLLDKTIAENGALVSTNEKLQEALERLKVERDRAVRSNDDSDARQRESRDNESAQYRQLKHERDSLVKESEKLRKLLRDAHRDHSEVWNLRKKEQEVLSALRLESDALLRNQNRGQGSLQRELDLLRDDKDNLQDLLNRAQRDLDALRAERTKASSGLDPAQRENEHLQRTKDLKANSNDGIHYRTMDRFSTPLNYRLEREFIGSVDRPPPPTEPRTAYAGMRHHQESNRLDKEYLGSLSAPPTDGDYGGQFSQSQSFSRVNPPPHVNLTFESGPVQMHRSNHSLEMPRRDASGSNGIASNGRNPGPRDGGQLAGVPAQSSSGRYQALYLSEDDDKELLIAALKRKVKLLERAFIVGDEQPNWPE